MAAPDRIFTGHEVRDPSWFRFIFSDTRMAPLWAVARLYLGYQWLVSGWSKAWGENRWINVSGPDGLPLKGFWERATAIPEEGRLPIVYDRYRDFLQYMLDNEWTPGFRG
jgi:thiosulfate dehydrogenase [quinone] large subunit